MKERSSFSGKIGFVLAAAGSAVGLGNIWRFPYLAAKNGGGLFLLCYIILALTFGFTLLTTEIAIGRKTKQSPLTAYGVIHKGWNKLGVLACIVPVIILPYYCAIGGWVVKYLCTFIIGHDADTVADGYFTGFITSDVTPIIYAVIFILATSVIVFLGVEGGIEKYSKILMPALFVMIVGIAIYSLTLKKEVDGNIVSGLDGLKVYILPDFTGLTFSRLLSVILDAMGQLFYSISVAMGIMIAYGSYVKKDVNLMTSINQIEIFDTLVAFFAGLMIIPAVIVFMGKDGLSAGPGLIFVSLPKILNEMGGIGRVIGIVFFITVLFAAITSSVSIMEAIVASLMDSLNYSRKKSSIIVTVYALILGVIVCLGYNKFYFELKLPNGSTGQILDVMDYLSNNIMMPVVAILTCILIGWVVKPNTVIDEVTLNGEKFGRKKLYIVMVKFIAPLLLTLLLLSAFGII